MANNNNFSNNLNQNLISQKNYCPAEEDIQNNNSDQIEDNDGPPSENNFIPLEVSLPPGKPPVNHPPPYTSNASRKIYNQDNNYSQANPNIHTGSSNIYNSTSKTPQNVPNMPIPQSLGGQQTNTPGQDYDPDDVPNDEEHMLQKKGRHRRCCNCDACYGCCDCCEENCQGCCDCLENFFCCKCCDSECRSCFCGFLDCCADICRCFEQIGNCFRLCD